MHFNPRRGITLTEILLVTAIMLVLLVLTIETFNRLGATRALDTNTQAIVLELEKARSLTLASKNEAQFGVHIASTSVTLFQGSSYSAGASSNVEVFFNPAVSISGAALAGGGSDVVFQRLTGKTANSGTI